MSLACLPLRQRCGPKIKSSVFSIRTHNHLLLSLACFTLRQRYGPKINLIVFIRSQRGISYLLLSVRQMLSWQRTTSKQSITVTDRHREGWQWLRIAVDILLQLYQLRKREFTVKRIIIAGWLAGWLASGPCYKGHWFKSCWLMKV